jgi:SAM-dependent methyltransferase
LNDFILQIYRAVRLCAIQVSAAFFHANEEDAHRPAQSPALQIESFAPIFAPLSNRMPRLLGTHSLASAWQRLLSLFRELGVWQTCALLLGTLDDRWLRSFDRRYRVRTSGFIQLDTTSFNRERLRDATQYGPTNGWAVRRILKQLKLSRELKFCDVGSGLGRICILAAEYGFSKVTGVELAPELCVAARENIAGCRLPAEQRARIQILQMDAFDYCATTDDDVFFMFRPFSGEFLGVVLDKLAARAKEKAKPLTLIYSERTMASVNHGEVIGAHVDYRKQCEAVILGQAFYVFECNPAANPAAR